MVERIDVIRDSHGKITDLQFNRSAGIYLGKSFSLGEEATVFKGKNAYGNQLVGSLTGDYGFAGKFY